MLRVFKGDKLIEIDTEIAMVTGNEPTMKMLNSKKMGFTADNKILVVPSALTESMSQLTWILYALFVTPM